MSEIFVDFTWLALFVIALWALLAFGLAFALLASIERRPIERLPTGVWKYTVGLTLLHVLFATFLAAIVRAGLREIALVGATVGFLSGLVVTAGAHRHRRRLISIREQERTPRRRKMQPT